MNYQTRPDTVSWELTMGCNLRCGHCGSACSDRLPDELSTAEALQLAAEIARIRPLRVSFLGGEPLLRGDWDKIAARITDSGVIVGLITNGTLLDDASAKRMRDCKLAIVSVSMDGTRATHDRIRGKGCYQKAERAFELLGKYGICRASNTTVTRENIGELPELRNELIRMGVRRWQLQPGLPVGRMNSDAMIGAEELSQIIRFSLEENRKGEIDVILADSIGYYTRAETLSRQLAMGTPLRPVWDGCNAGIRTVGVLHNGDVTGCVSIRDKRFIEGNVRKRALGDIWEDPTSFSWRRRMKGEELGGFCSGCGYRAKCLGGCSNTRLTMNGGLGGENILCIYRFASNASSRSV